MEDCDILALFTARSETAIEKTAEKYGRYCFRIAHNILENDEDAEECVNDTFLRAWNAIPPQQPSNLKTYLGKITRRLSLNAFDKRTADKRGGNRTALCLDELADCLPSESADDLVDSVALKEMLTQFLQGLPLRERRIFLKRYWYMMSIAEIAAEHGVTENHVSVILMRTRKKLKAVLEKEEFFV